MICKFDFSMKLSSNGWQTISMKRHLSLTACAWFKFRQQLLEEISSRRCKQMLHLRPDLINSLSCTPAASRVPQKQVPNIHLQASRLSSSSSSRSWRGLTRRENICICAIPGDFGTLLQFHVIQPSGFLARKVGSFKCWKLATCSSF